jgi:hypothetical protein
MPDLTTPAGRDELRADTEAVIRNVPEQSVVARVAHGCLALLDQADAGEREWRPIDSAPKDGTNFLASLSNGWVVILSEVPGWDRFAWYRCSAQAVSVPVARTHHPAPTVETHDNSSSFTLATHWMPLPPPPARAAAEETPKHSHPGTCAKCKRPFATVEDYRSGAVAGKCSTWYAYRDEESYADCRRAAAATTEDRE